MLAPPDATDDAYMLLLPTRILAFGDSLTAGMVARDTYAPYGDRVAARLGAAVTSRGVVMESVHAMPARLRRVLADNNDARFDAMIILGGSNDLWKGDPDAIWQSLQQCYSMARSEDAALGMATLPPFEPAPMRWLEPLTGCATLTETTRQEVNARVRDAAGSSEDAFLVDLAAICDEAPLARPDGMHLEAAGYEALGEAAASAIVEFCGGERGAVPSRPPLT